MPKEPNFPYAGSPERYELWKKKDSFINPLKESGMPSLQEAPDHELSPEETVDVDDRALRKNECPNIVFGRPHAGEFVPEQLWKIMRPGEGQASFKIVDRGTDYIFRSPNIPSVGSKISRLIIDPNRAPLAGQDSGSKVAPGAVLWRQDFFGKEIYQEDKVPTNEEIKKLSEKYYLPYYNKMMAMIGSVADKRDKKNERILVLDGHSFPVSKNFPEMAAAYKIKEIKSLPLFILGEGAKTSADPDIIMALENAIYENFWDLPEKDQKKLLQNSTSGEIVAVNKFFPGVYNVKFYGQRQEGVSALQLELNEGMFVDEVNDDYFQSSYDFSRLEMVQKLVEKSCLDIDKILKGK